MVRNDGLKYIVADANLPKRFVLTLPRLVPGAVIQYRATFPCNSHGLTYPNYAPLWNGFQHEYLDGDAESLGWTHYPADNLRMIVLHDKEIEIEAKVLNDDGRMKVEQMVTPDGIQHYLRVSGYRPARPSEDYTPPLSDTSPQVMLRRVFKGEESETAWPKQVKAWRKDWLRHTDPDPDPDLLAGRLPELPAAVELTQGELRYRLESKITDGALVVSRRLDLAGRFPKADIDKVQRFFLDAAAHDGDAKLMLSAPAAGVAAGATAVAPPAAAK